MTESERISDRPHWQRSEGMVVFDREFRYFFPPVLASVDSAVLENKFSEVHDFYRIHDERPASQRAVSLAFAACAAVSKATPFVPYGAYGPDVSELFRPEPVGAKERIDRFTRKGLHTGLWEAAETVLYFPLNLITIAEFKRRKQGIATPLASDLFGVADMMRRSWFHEACERASSTANSVWRTVTSLRVFPVDCEDGQLTRIEDILQFDFFNTPEGLGFTFSEAAVGALKSRLHRANQKAAELPTKDERDQTLGGMSVGCLGRFTEPLFDSSAGDAASLNDLATHYRVGIDELLAPRSESVIAFGLNQIGAFLERAAVIEQNMTP